MDGRRVCGPQGEYLGTASVLQGRRKALETEVLALVIEEPWATPPARLWSR